MNSFPKHALQSLTELYCIRKILDKQTNTAYANLSSDTTSYTLVTNLNMHNSKYIQTYIH